MTRAPAAPVLAFILGASLAGCGGAERLTGDLVGGQRVIEVHARRFEYSPNVITVQRGETVVIQLTSEDVMHGLHVDGYDVEAFVMPGETRVIAFTADKPGRFSFRCSVTCGDFHPYMIGYLKVLPNRTYHAGLLLVGLLGLGFLALDRRRARGGGARLFGIVPVSWRFELTRYRPVRALLKSRWFPAGIILVNFLVLVAVLVAGLVGGYSAGNANFGVVLIWILWWILLMTLFVPLAGRFWCMLCPFPLIGDWLQRGKLIAVGRRTSWGLNRKWPKRWRNLWPVTAIFTVCTFFVGFFSVAPLATFLLLGLMLGGAIVIAVMYEKRTFCLYACPVSGFQGLYANFAATEVRVKDTAICADCMPKVCYVGSDEGYGCPWGELPFDLNRNTYCGMCMECFKTCPHDNMALNARPFGADFLEPRRRTDDIQHRRGWDEAFKSLTMIGVLFAFFLTMQGPHGWIKDAVRADSVLWYGAFLLVYVALNFLLVPGLFLGVSALSRWAGRAADVSLKDVFVGFSYCLIPLGMARWAGFSLAILFPNGSYVPRVLSDPFARGWDLLGTASLQWTPVLTGALPYLQLLILGTGLAFSLEYGSKLARQVFPDERAARRAWIPMLLFIVGLSLFFVWLFEG